MLNEFKTFYLKELIMKINSLALESMLMPCLESKKADGTQMTLSEISAYNSLVAWHNEGVREIADRLVDRLSEEAATDE